ncbi:MAG: hypothetical protein V2A34_09515, partial [Lentisphaerota bacterium]
TAANTFTIYGLWLNDPKVDGIGYNLYAAAEEMDSIYQPSESNGDYWLIAEPPQDESEMSNALAQIDNTEILLAASESNPEMASYLRTLFAPSSRFSKNDAALDGFASPDLFSILPVALKTDAGFLQRFNQTGTTNYYVVNVDNPLTTYVLAGGGQRGPASSLYVLKLDYTNGAFEQATWKNSSFLYPPVPREAAVWAALQQIGRVETVSDNLLTNSGFEVNSESGMQIANWAVEGACCAENRAARTPDWGLAVEAGAGSYAVFHQDHTNGLEGAEYDYSIWAFKDSGFSAGSLEIKLEWYAGDGTPLGNEVQSVFPSLTNDVWQRISVGGTAPAGTHLVRSTAWVGGIVNNGFALKFDDASLIRTAGPVLVDADLVYDPAVDVSPFLPRWQLTFDVDGDTEVREIRQSMDLSSDTDGDGMSDLAECYIGSDPSSSSSLLDIDGHWDNQLTPDKVTIVWPSVYSKYYSLYRTTNLNNGFQVLNSHIRATPPLNTYTDDWNNVSGYYRIEME